MRLSPDSADPMGAQPGAREVEVLQHDALRRILQFTGYSIDDVVSNPIARNIVRGYFRVHLQIVLNDELRDVARKLAM